MNNTALKEEGLSLSELELCWVALKADENEAKKKRLEIEDMILEQYGDQLKALGTTSLSHIKVTQEVTKSYDQDELKSLSQTIPANSFPFKMEFKEISAGVRYVQEHDPQAWALIKTALSEKPKKAQFAVLTLKEKKQ